ncbi:MAG TPA: 3-hydroxyacyl-CoA dehydrogenase NAD-binding domain-containing protein [Isosphaeraceae bacterium]|jgi:3-hydroxyacyl-CoA dehydrogenase/enoyl-CoA hydratase/3-hydroxybutyryl-CoA epimerase/3-hydroxyacyl-CoA dehydrogenase/enoyl-CoA hydratase/3-hydroxybutyryl-CoA epimerase/enoyl-CoA isomerase|nr:3-hydroxyacyl-CoA dehydrogenase NAD-binding domain-containing protein [Isosphaeraceae bacterium]
MATAFRLEELEGKIALLTFDVPGKKVNTFGQPVLQELAALVGQLASRSDLRGLLFRSGKPGQFIAGADLNELGAMAYVPREMAAQAIGFGHHLFGKISQLPFPTVALIDGNCMGGGTEVTLAMDYRIASASPQTKIALPETKIGLLPGWGGTQRLPRLIGLQAIDMICSGEPVSAEKAVALGLVFDAVPPDHLVEDGRKLIEFTQQSGEWKELRQRRSQPLGLSQDEMFFAFAAAEGAIKAKTKGQYPAPLVALRAIKDGINLPLEEGLRVEQQAALELVGTPTCANLIGVFFMNNRLQRDPGVDNPNVAPRDVKRVGVLGAGQMGSGIATAHARSGIPSAMVDVDNDRISAGMARAQDVVMSRIKIGRATPMDMAKMLSHLSTSTSHCVFADCDVVIEAVTENEKLKTEMYKELGKALHPDAILASNTSTISITRMAESAPNAERFVGMHFFYPVDRMELVEVIRGAKTSDETVATIVALAKRIRKSPIVVRDCAGFLVNRVLLPYMNEALLLLQEGAPMDAIDDAATKFGMPMGPIALHDFVGLDTACYAGKVMVAAYSDRAVPTPILDDLVKAGRLGQKSGAGFRKYGGKSSRPQPDPTFEPILAKYRKGSHTFTAEELTDRLFLPMLLEATRVLEEHIVREPADVDMGLILGIGFPPFRGGILRWCDSEGASKILERVERYRSLGKRFEPTETLTKMAQTGAKFYPLPKLNFPTASKA